jgi:hypothetical protein
MNRLPVKFLFALVAAVALERCVIGNCAAVCPDGYTLTFVDVNGAAVSGVSGTVTNASGGVVTFDCSPGASTDAGNGSQPCQGNTFTGDSYSDHRDITVSAAAGTTSFSGTVKLTWTPTGSSVCGSACEAGSARVTLR